MTERIDQTPQEASFAIGPLAEVAREIHKKRIGALADYGAQLREQIRTVQEAIGGRRQAAEDLLGPLLREMDAAYAAYLVVSARIEAEKSRHASELAPLLYRLEELTRTINRTAPGFGTDMRQWQKPIWYDGPSREALKAAQGDHGC